MHLTLKKYIPHLNAWQVEEPNPYYAVVLDGIEESLLSEGQVVTFDSLVPYFGIMANLKRSEEHTSELQSH